MAGKYKKKYMLSTGLRSWFAYVLSLLAAYGVLLQSGIARPEAEQKQPPVDFCRDICISLKTELQQPQKKKPLRLNIKKSRRFQKLIDQAGNRYEVDPDLIRAVIMAESGYNPKAVSHKGAGGLMQLMPKTAAAMGVKDLFDPEHNINGGVRYLKKLLDRYDGDVELALAAYNAGSRKVRKYQGVPPFKATKVYIQKVSEYFLFYKNFRKNGLNEV